MLECPDSERSTGEKFLIEADLRNELGGGRRSSVGLVSFQAQKASEAATCSTGVQESASSFDGTFVASLSIGVTTLKMPSKHWSQEA